MRGIDIFIGAMLSVIALAVAALIFLAGTATGIDIVVKNCQQHASYNTGTERIKCEAMK